MTGESKDKLIVLLVSFALFMGGVSALSLERGTTRTAVLAGCIAGLSAIALRQSVRRRRKREK